ncbi:aromatic ring-hydroxylating dioxygenase subunit alpha [Sphingomonas sp. YL-JM2C]
MSKDIRNLWYVAALSTEIADGPVGRRICSFPVVLYRERSGAVAALFDRCPHRFVPLSRGRCEGDRLVCGYHGLAYDGAGKCVANPQGTVTRSLDVRSFPVEERHGLVWIWMGDPALRDTVAIPDFSLLDRPAMRPQYGYMWTAAHFELMTDNIMDLSHIEFLHADTLGTEKIRDAKVQARVEGETVYSGRTVHDEILPPFLEGSFQTDGRPVTRSLSVRWNAPALMLLTVGVDPAGPEKALRETFNMHFITPETSTTCHYFWAATRPYGPDDPERDRRLREGLERAFRTEDKPMIEAQQLVTGEADLLDLKPALFRGDGAAIHARRILTQLRRAEEEA